MRRLRKNGLYFAWVIALIGLCVSLIYGEIFGNSPCPLCWYQRTFLFPLVILLGIAVYRGETMIVVYAIPLAILGSFFSIVHILQPYVSFIQKAHICRMGVPCSTEGFHGIFSFISLIGFVLMTWLLFMVKRK
ncbi:MAG TPA: disulfide bond formation protein B [Chlamydiales bacterium]|nr:disulfide bond formation protein B [Chlamydiales bacterium]